MLKAARIPLAQAIIAFCVLLFYALVAIAVAAGRGQDQPSQPPRDLVRAAVANEIAAESATSPRHMFRDRKQTPHGTQTRLYVETTQAMAALAVAFNDQPLDAEQKQAESDRLARLINSPEQLRKKQAREKEDEERTLLIVKALPDAFNYEYAPANSEAADAVANDHLVRVNFVPNPAYNPPSHVEQVLTGMSGYLLIDAQRKRLARIDGTLTKEVTFGWGIFGHLDKGGHFLVQQGDVAGGEWDLIRMSLNFTGKIFMFKSLNISSDEVFSDYRQVPANLTFAQGVEMLMSEQDRLAHAARGDESAMNKHAK
jgi:hypothetical protein